ncbi:helix-turn-helix domain-containing protein [Paenibacillus sp. 19GGS1-52]|uniref:response regulator transcription factor n=1 Tax=Paenibacillus sp. 19GGS1-52 TaxID=2758563 RepID=UPI001EFAF476|nr:helix-turn-helix domain-containing protein [Paenibacillus sp. 19GGS1-52]ULO08997.1 helix-turn-helix domain-containing protein [Paenibacillus sp. 19GGS1-52]
MRCMLIDDDIPTVEALRGIVNWDEFGITEVQTAHNIQDAKQLFDSGEPDLIICDIEMPRGSGIDMIQWTRERQYEGGFIFLTCHESFSFASKAISYNADSYLVKPLDKQELEAALRKSIELLKKKIMMGEYSKLGLAWLKNKDLVERGFWSDVLTAAISPRMQLIQSEMQKRELALSVHTDYQLLLVSVPRSQIERVWDESIFHYALSNLISEILISRVSLGRIIAYQADNVFYNAILIESGADMKWLQDSAEHIIQMCRQYLKCTATCYFSEKAAVSGLSQIKAELEQLDESNIIFRGKVHDQNEPFHYDTSERFTLDIELFTLLFVQKEKAQIVNRLKKELELLTSLNKLDSTTLHSIREDFLQVVYSLLSRQHIQAHRLFADEVSQQLAQNAESSVFDFMKWAQALTDKTVDSIKQVLQSEGVVERAKRYIHDNYAQDLSREDVAASVYLTADYLAKIFKNETGQTVKEYLNECRIRAAKQMLIESTTSIGDIAMDTGFDTISYFSTVFKKLTGETPIAYRSKHRTVR